MAVTYRALPVDGKIFIIKLDNFTTSSYQFDQLRRQNATEPGGERAHPESRVAENSGKYLHCVDPYQSEGTGDIAFAEYGERCAIIVGQYGRCRAGQATDQIQTAQHFLAAEHLREKCGRNDTRDLSRR